MPRVWSRTSFKHQQGFSVVEILLAVTVFGMLITGVTGAMVYGRSSTVSGGDRVRGDYLAEEGVEAVRNIEAAGFATLTDGTYGLVQSGNTWTLSGSSDSNGIYSRSVTVAANGTNRKKITSNVSWDGVSTGQVSVVTQLTNWNATLPKYWSNSTQKGGVDVTGTIAGYKVATAGSYAYYVRNSSTGPNFFIVNISTPTAPTVVGTLTLAGTPTNIAVNGNYAYVSNASTSAELQIVNVTTPTTPTLAGTYNASGTAGGGRGVYVVGNLAYLVRAANSASDEFVIVNVATPSSPTRVAGYGLAVNMNEVYVNGTTAYVATASDTQELLVINLANSPTLSLGTAINMSGTVDATTIAGNGTSMVVGQGTALRTISAATPLVPVVSGNLTLTGTISDVAYDTAHNYIDVGTNVSTAEFQVVDASALATPTVLDTVDITGTVTLNGVAYNSTYDIVAGASSNTAQEAIILGPN